MTPDKADDDLNSSETLVYLQVIKTLAEGGDSITNLAQHSEALNELLNCDAHKAFNGNEEISLTGKGSGTEILDSDKAYDWLCSLMLKQINEAKGNPLDSVFEVDQTWHRAAPALWLAILGIGRHLPTSMNIDHLLFKKETELDEHLERMKAAGMDAGYHNMLCELINHIPGARDFIGRGDSETSKSFDREHLKILTSFSQTPAGIMLAISIVQARKCDSLDEFTESLKDKRFVRALFGISTNFLNALKNKDTLLVDTLVGSSNDEYYDFLIQLLSGLQKTPRELQDVISRRKESLRRRQPNNSELTTKQLIAEMWIPKVLWEKNAAEILDCLPELSSGSTEPDHTRDCKKIGKAIRELGLSIQK